MRLPGALILFAGLAGGQTVSLTIGAMRVTPERWNKEANCATIERYARQAAAKGVQLVITPEGFLEGYVANQQANPGVSRERYFAVGETLEGPLLTRLRELARSLGIYLLAGFAERRGERMYNSVAIFSPAGKAVHHYSKMHNADDEPFNTTGTELPVTSTPLGRWGTLICFDRQLPETARVLAIRGAQVILVPAWGAYGEMNDAMMRTRAAENGVWVVFVHPKRVLVIDPGGKVVAKDAGEGDELVTARIELDGRIGRGPIRHRKPELYGDILADPGRD